MVLIQPVISLETEAECSVNLLILLVMIVEMVDMIM